MTPDPGEPDNVTFVATQVSAPLAEAPTPEGGVVLEATVTTAVFIQPPIGSLTVTVYVPPPLPVAFWELTPEVIELPPGAVQV